jgi:hypothetical protein
LIEQVVSNWPGSPPCQRIFSFSQVMVTVSFTPSVCLSDRRRQNNNFFRCSCNAYPLDLPCFCYLCLSLFLHPFLNRTHLTIAHTLSIRTQTTDTTKKNKGQLLFFCLVTYSPSSTLFSTLSLTPALSFHSLPRTLTKYLVSSPSLPQPS